MQLIHNCHPYHKCLCGGQNSVIDFGNRPILLIQCTFCKKKIELSYNYGMYDFYLQADIEQSYHDKQAN